MSYVVISVTGRSKELTKREKKVVRNAIASLKVPPRLFFSGAAPGVDVWAAEAAFLEWPDSRHVVLIPRWQADPGGHAGSQPCKHDRAGVARLRKLGLEITASPAGCCEERNGLLVRNSVLAHNCTHLLAFPASGTMQQRSGTWHTVRRALEIQTPVKVVPLNGDPVRRL